MKKHRLITLLICTTVMMSSTSVYAGNSNFSDINENYWASGNITALVNDGIISGYPDSTFKADGTVTYAEFIKLAVIAVTRNDPGVAFSGHWAKNYYETAILANLFSRQDIPETLLNELITRGDMALIAAQAVNAEVSQTELNIVASYLLDTPQEENKKCAIAKAYALGLICGYENRTFQPNANLSRAEAATVILRILDPQKRANVNLDLLSSMVAPQVSKVAASNQAISSDSYEYQVLGLVNEVRAQKGLSALIYNAALSDVAKVKAEDMGNQGYFAHNSPTYGTPFAMMKSFGVKYSAAGENLAKGYKTPEKAMEALMNSPCHKEVILEPSFTQIGIAYTVGKDGIAYWVQMFIRP